jgi:hypothetical protein
VGEPTLKLYSLQSCFNTRSGLQRRRPPPSDGGTSAMTRWNSYPVTLGTARTAVGAGAAGACGTTLGAVVVGAVVGGAVVGGLGTEARKIGTARKMHPSGRPRRREVDVSQNRRPPPFDGGTSAMTSWIAIR